MRFGTSDLDVPADEVKSTASDARRRTQALAKDVKRGARKQYLRGRIALAKASASRRGGDPKRSAAVAGAASAAGAAGVYFLDPAQGRNRRRQAREKVVALFKKDERTQPTPAFNGSPQRAEEPELTAR